MGFVVEGSRGRVVGEYRGKKDPVSSLGHDCQRICCFRKKFRIATFLCVKGKAREMHWKILGKPSMLKIMSLKKISRISKRLRCPHLWQGLWVTPHGVRHSMIGVWCFHLRCRLYENLFGFWVWHLYYDRWVHGQSVHPPRWRNYTVFQQLHPAWVILLLQLLLWNSQLKSVHLDQFRQWKRMQHQIPLEQGGLKFNLRKGTNLFHHWMYGPCQRLGDCFNHSDQNTPSWTGRGRVIYQDISKLFPARIKHKNGFEKSV